MRRIGIVAVLLAISLAAEIAGANPSAAQEQPGMGSEYGIAEWVPSVSNRGSQVTMYVATGHADDCAAGFYGFIAQALWEGTANSTSYYAEAGYTHCFENTSGLFDYYADNRPIYGYAEHRLSSITAGGLETWKIHYIGSNTWEIDKNNSIVANSVSNPAGGTWMDTGLEATSPFSVLNCGQSENLQYLKPNGGPWTTYWSGAALRTLGSGNVRWVTTYLHETDWENHSGGC
jgi:hypothetical protein